MLACGAAALASAVLAAPLALSGAVEPAIVAVVVLLQLALVEPYAAITTAVRQYPALRTVLRRIGASGVLDAPGRNPTPGPGSRRPEASPGLAACPAGPAGRPTGIRLRGTVRRLARRSGRSSPGSPRRPSRDGGSP